MPRYRGLYLKDELSRRFREWPSGSVRKQIKARDYPVTVEIEAAGEYAAWQALQAFGEGQPGEAAARPFTVGDALETEDGKLRLCLFGGFEDATWWTPELPTADGAQPEGCAAEAQREAGPIPEPRPGPEPRPEPPPDPFPGPKPGPPLAGGNQGGNQAGK